VARWLKDDRDALYPQFADTSIPVTAAVSRGRRAAQPATETIAAGNDRIV